MNHRLHRILLLVILCLSGFSPALFGQFDFDYPGPDTFYLDSNCQDVLDFDGMPPTVSSNIGANIITPPTGVDEAITGYAVGDTIFSPQVVTVGFIAADDQSNIDTFLFNITFLDTIAPVFTSPAPGDVSVDCFGDIPAPFILTAEDNCQGTIFTSAVDTPPLSGPNCGAPVTITRTWTATDNSGNSTVLTQLIDVGVDNEPPVIGMMPMDGSGDCSNANPAYNTWLLTQQNIVLATASDNCNVLIVSHDGPVNIPNECNTITVTFTVEDGCGLTDTASATFEVTDSQAPTLSGVPADTTIACGEAIPPAPAVTASDNCDTNLPAVTLDENSDQTVNGSCMDANYTITRTWSVADNCGNLTEITQTISVVDTIAPVFSPPADTTLDCGSDISPTITGEVDPGSISDNCLIGFVMGFTDDSTALSCPQEIRVDRTWMVADSCGNVRSEVQQIFLIDTIAPTFTPPSSDSLFLDCDASTDPADTGEVTGISDNCDGGATATFVDLFTNQVCTHSYTIVRTWFVEDACGNVDSTKQYLILRDTLAPLFTQGAQDETISCTTDADADQAFTDWIALQGNAVADDNCDSDVSWSAVNANDGAPATLPPADCIPDVVGVYRQQTVLFIATDDCLNADTTMATFTVQDNTPPQLSNCPSDTTISNDPGVCEGTITLPPPFIVEECGNEALSLAYSQTLPLTGPGGLVDTLETPVNDVHFAISVASSPVQASGDVTLDIRLENADGESPTEFMQIFGEDGSFLGNTNLTPTQCDTSLTTFTISAAVFNAWAFDGIVELTAVPNDPAPLPGRFTVNAICGGSTMTASLSYPALTPDGTRLEYSLNAGPRVLVDPISPFDVTLPLGMTDVIYYVTDCAGNESSCSFAVTVEDTEPPVITCPADFVVPTDPNECSALVDIPIPLGVTDNCEVTVPVTQTVPATFQESLLSFTINPNLGVYNADDKSFLFFGVSPSAVGTVTVTFTLQADIDEPGEFFEILDPEGNVLGTTEIGQPNVVPGDCNTPSTATFTIPAATFNSWAVSGFVTFIADSNIDFPVPPPVPDPGINPCDPGAVNNNGDNDGTSFITCTLTYETVAPTFFATGATTLPPTPLNNSLVPPQEVLNEGVTTVSYVVEDVFGNADTCSFEITVADTQTPTAVCQSSIVFIDPSGVATDTIVPADVDDGSFDNCGIEEMLVDPNLITCDLIGDTIQVELTVIDSSGNAGTCNGFVRVEGEAPAPTFFIEACGGDSLFLFANPPGDPDNYLYTWTGPGFSSSQQDPIIPNVTTANQGTYTVVIEGLTGCTADGEVQVPINDLPVTPVIGFDEADICSDEDIVLETMAPPGGSMIEYQWYSGTFPAGTLVATTPVPSYTYPGPHMAGDSCFYVIIIRDGCPSNPSASKCVTITEIPVAETNDDVIDVCEGETIVLGSTSSGPGYTYYWTGPNNYEAFVQNPMAIQNATLLNDGLYELVTTVNGCVSDPAFTVVNVLEKPDTPEIGNNTTSGAPACIGDTIVLEADIQGMTTYTWNGPGPLLFQTDTNVLVLENAIQAYAGEWTLEVVDNLCVSDPSLPTTVYIANLPVVQASSNSPVCDNESLTLSVNETPGAIYTWETPGGNMLNGQFQSIPPVAGTYTVTVVSAVGCENTDAVSVAVNAAPDITSVSNNAPTCPDGPEDVCLFATVFPADDGTYDYSWQNANGSVVSTDSVGKLLNAIAQNVNGEYTLVLTDGNGCMAESEPTVVDMGLILANPIPPQPDPTGPYCEGDEITIQIADTYQGTQETYHWITPVGSFTSSGPSLDLPPLTLANNGQYSVYVEVDGCSTDTSGVTTLTVNAIPTGTITSNSPVCEGEPITLEFQNCIPGATYEWFGPPPFSSSNCNPVTPPATLGSQGTYTLVVTRNGCTSEEFSTFVMVNELPNTPVANNSGDVCIDAPGAELTLSVSPASATPGAVYAWFVDGMPLNTPSGALTFTITDFSLFAQGEYEFTVVAILNGCESSVSVPTVVNMFETPSSIANAGMDQNFCENEPVVLNATPPSQGTGLWSQLPGNPGGATFVNPDMASTEVMGTVPGNFYEFVWSLSNGACADYSQDTIEIFIDIIEQANAGPDIDICATNTAQLSSLLPVTGTGSWSQPNSQAGVGVVIVDPADPQTQVQGLVPGNTYLFFWTLADNGCGESVDEMEVIVADAEAEAGLDFFECGDGCTFLGASEPAAAVGVWSSPDPGIIFENPLDNQSEVCNLVPGINTFIWTLNEGECGENGVDTVQVEYKYAPTALDDQVIVPFAGLAEFDVSLNDDIPADYFVEIASMPEHGQLIQVDEGRFEYQADINYIGEDEFAYLLCSESCECSEAVVTLSVGREAECIIPTIITPNEDGVNDLFVIPCLAETGKFPDNEVAIFNVWGDEVFRAAPYLNNWNGRYNGEPVPAGTYFYVVNFGDGSEVQTGFLVVHR